eukprot:6492384-Amphidinium_carterae.13
MQLLPRGGTLVPSGSEHQIDFLCAPGLGTGGSSTVYVTSSDHRHVTAVFSAATSAPRKSCSTRRSWATIVDDAHFVSYLSSVRAKLLPWSPLDDPVSYVSTAYEVAAETLEATRPPACPKYPRLTTT